MSQFLRIHVLWDKRDRKFAGSLLKTISDQNFQDKAFDEWKRIAELPVDHADAWQKSHTHAFIILAMRMECVKSEFNDKRIAELAIENAAKSFNGDFELYHKNMTMAINAALRVGVDISDNMMKSCFNNNFETTDQDWKIV